MGLSSRPHFYERNMLEISVLRFRSTLTPRHRTTGPCSIESLTFTSRLFNAKPPTTIIKSIPNLVKVKSSKKARKTQGPQINLRYKVSNPELNIAKCYHSTVKSLNVCEPLQDLPLTEPFDTAKSLLSFRGVAQS